MGRPKSEVKNRRTLAIAYLLMEGERAVDIAAALNLERYAVSKAKAAAEERGILAAVPPEPGPNWNRDLEVQARTYLGYGSHNRLVALLENARKKDLLTPPLSIRVYPSLHRSEVDWQSRLDNFGLASARYVRKLILSATSVGVSWGRTLDSVVSGLEQLPEVKRQSTRGIWFLPLCGEPLGRVDDNFRSSATTLCARLAESINGSRKHTLSLSAVPFIIPLDFKDTIPSRADSDSTLSEVEVVKELIGRVSAHSDIFGDWSVRRSRLRTGRTPRRPWCSRLSMILTSVGADGYPFGQPDNEYLKSAGLHAKDVHDVAVADISGILLQREHPKPMTVGNSGSNLLERIRNHWTGISLSDLTACADRARKASLAGETGLGVVVTAVGRSKAPVVLECMKREGGLISHLIVDSDLETTLCRLVASQLTGHRGHEIR